MKMIHFGILLLSLSCSSRKQSNGSSAKRNADSTIVKLEFQKYFENCFVEGSVVIYDNTSQKWILSDTSEVDVEVLPASTFKIINLLIALETKTITDENQIIKWIGTTDTLKYGYRPETYHDMTVKEAFEVSAGWVFIELAKKIGKQNYKKYLSEADYGNGNLSQIDTDFWNFGNFGISPMNQVQFIKKMYEGHVPFSKRNVEIVKRVMISEQTQNYTIGAKTGWTRDKEINTGWWVGYIQKKKKVYFFATRLLQDRKHNRNDFSSCRKDIT
jgi:beta-lactamase class D